MKRRKSQKSATVKTNRFTALAQTLKQNIGQTNDIKLRGSDEWLYDLLIDSISSDNYTLFAIGKLDDGTGVKS